MRKSGVADISESRRDVPLDASPSFERPLTVRASSTKAPNCVTDDQKLVIEVLRNSVHHVTNICSKDPLPDPLLRMDLTFLDHGVGDCKMCACTVSKTV